MADIKARKKIKGIEDEAFELESRVAEPFEVALIGKEWIDPNLVFKLNIAPGRDWEQCFRSYSGTTGFCTDGFRLDPKCFTISGNKILVPNAHGDKNHLTDVCNAMPGLILQANELMKHRIEKRIRKRMRRWCVREKTKLEDVKAVPTLIAFWILYSVCANE